MRPSSYYWLACVLFAFTAGAWRAAATGEPALEPSETATIVRLDPALDGVIAPGTKIDRVVTGFKFTEGPMWRDGRLWFSDLVGNQMISVSPDGQARVLMEHSGGVSDPPPGSYMGSNAMVGAPDGSVLMIQQGGRRIVRLDAQLKITAFLDNYEGKRFNSPNDLVFAPDGALWFTDPPFGLAQGEKDPEKELSFNGVFRYFHGKLSAPIRDLTLPNGIGFSKDGKTLYVSNSGPQMAVKKFRVASDGSVSQEETVIAYPGHAADVPDGLKLDSAGNLWTSGPGGFRVISPQGKVLGQIKLPEVAANMAWGDDGSTAYFTASTSIYRLRAAIPGQKPLYQR